jgi:hypothetical protein
MIVEGRIDSKNVGQMADGVVKILQHAKASKDVVESAEKIGDIIEEVVKGAGNE